MEESIFNYSDLFNDDGGIEKLESKIKSLGAFIESEAKKLKGKISVVDPTNTAEVEKLAKEVELLKAQLEKLNKVKKENQKTNQKASQLRGKELIESQKMRDAMQKERKEAAAIAKIKNAQAGSVEYLRAKLALVTIAWSKLTKEELENGKVGKRLVNSKREITDELKRMESATGDNRRNVGNYSSALSGLNAVGNTLRSTMIGLGASFGVFSVLKDVYNIIKQNDEAFASLQAITGLTGEKFELFRTEINQVAFDLKVSSTEVAKAAELIASAQPKLLGNAEALAAVTREAITLNKAIKGDLSETSLALVGVMNQFGLEAEEAARIINVLAAGSQAGAATVNQINESIVKFGTTADLMNISVEESVGLIETLGEKAIFGADAGTALRNILLKMSSIDVLPEKALKQLEKYGVDTNKVKDTTLSLEERLKELSKVASDSTAIMQIFGTENATAATVLLNNIDTYGKMTDAVTGTNVAQEQAAINSNTLANKALELRASWENLVVKWSQGTDVLGGLKSILGFVADNLETIITWVLRGAKAFITYKVAMKLFRVEVDAAGNSMKAGLIPAMGNFVKGIGTSLTSIKGFTGAMRGLGAAMKSIPFAAWASALLTLGPMLWDFVKGLGSAKREVNELSAGETVLNEVTNETSTRLAKERVELKLVFEALKRTKEGTDERRIALEKVNDKYDLTLQNLEDEGEFVRQLDSAYQGLLKTLEKKIRVDIITEKLTKLLREKIALEESLVNIQKNSLELDLATSVDFDQSKLGSLGTQSEQQLRTTQGLLDIVNEKISALETSAEDLDILGSIIGDETTGGTGKTTIREVKDTLADELSQLEPIFKEASDKLILNPTISSQEQFDQQRLLIEKVFDNLEEKYKNNALKLKEITDFKYKLISEADEKYIAEWTKREEERMKKMEQIAKLELEIRTLNLDSRIILAEQLQKESNEKLLELNELYNNATTEADKEKYKAQIEGELNYQRDIIAAKIELQKQIIQMDADFRMQQLEQDAQFRRDNGTMTLQDEEILSLELQKINLEKNNAIAKLDEDLNNQLSHLNDQRVEDQIKSWEDFNERFEQIMNKILDKLVEISEKEVERAEEKVSKQEEAVAEQERRAEEGLTNTLAFEQKAMAQREAELIEAQKKLERRMKIQALYASYKNYANQGDPNALGKALTDMAILEAIEATFGGFSEGGYTGDGGKHDIAGVTHKKEFVIDADTTSKMGLQGATMSDFKNRFMGGIPIETGIIGTNFFKDQNDMFKADVPDYGSEKVAAHIKQLTKVMEQKPDHTLEIIDTMEGLKKMVLTAKYGKNSKVYTTRL